MKNNSAQLFGIHDCIYKGLEYKIDNNEKKYQLQYFVYDDKDGDNLPERCPDCGSKNFYKHGTRELNIHDTPQGGFPVKMCITVPRKRCQNCKSIWQPQIKGVNENHKMTDRAFLDITQKSIRRTFEEITYDYMISANTVKNIFVEFLDENKDNLRFKTPVFLGIDEIKLDQLGEITVITDLEHHTLYDILPKRNQEYLTHYFEQLPDREKVLWVCSDMYRPFEKSIDTALPNAQWAIDHFHVVKKANEALDYVRKKVQAGLSRKDRISVKKGLKYTLTTRRKNLTIEQAEAIKRLRELENYRCLAIAFDLKEDFFDIYDSNMSSKDNAINAFYNWEKSIPEDEIFVMFRELAETVYRFFDQIFNFWSCPIAISNGFTECANRLIREDNLRGRGYSFEVLRGRTLYRHRNLEQLLNNKLILGPVVAKYAPIFHMDSTKDEYLEEN